VPADIRAVARILVIEGAKSCLGRHITFHWIEFTKIVGPTADALEN
jgi:hypothetical protein